MSELDDYPHISEFGIGGPYYSEEDRAQIIDALPQHFGDEVMRMLFKQLEESAEVFEFQDRMFSCPSGKEAYKIFEGIEAACGRVLSALMMKSASADSMPAFIYGNLEKQSRRAARYDDSSNDPLNVPAAVEGVVSLLHWARLEKHEASMVTAGKKDYPLEDLFSGLKRIWTDTLKFNVATSTSSMNGEAGGPMVRFFLACLSPLDVDMTSEGVRDRIRRQFMGK